MLHLSDKDFITRFDIGLTPALRNEVDTRCRAAGENDLMRVNTTDKLSDMRAGLLELAGCPFSKRMQAAMNVRVILLVLFNESIDNRAWFLSCSGIIEID